MYDEQFEDYQYDKEIAKGYIKMQDDKNIKKKLGKRKNSMKDHIEDDEEQQDVEEYGEQPETTNQQARLASYFNFVRQVRNQYQYRGFTAPAKEQSQESSRLSFIGQIWNQYRGSTAPAKEQSQEPSRLSFISQIWNQYRESTVPAKEQSQEPSHLSFVDQLPEQYKEFVTAARFLSILPFPGDAQGLVDSEEAGPELVIGSAYFPLVGLVIALIVCLVLLFGLAVHLPSLVIAALVVVALIWLTGGLHLDGLMDACDGLFGGDTRERKLEIMHDSHSGAFGVLGGISILLLKFAIFASLDLNHLALALLIVLPLARWAMVLAMYMFPNAQLTGLGAAARQTVTRPRIFIAAITSLLIALIAGQLIGLVVWIVGSLVALIIGIRMTYVLGGLTGDIYGAIAEITEVVGLLVLVSMR
jgi:adenosylcobinamide-GDP ribazoletransferase